MRIATSLTEYKPMCACRCGGMEIDGRKLPSIPYCDPLSQKKKGGFLVLTQLLHPYAIHSAWGMPGPGSRAGH